MDRIAREAPGIVMQFIDVGGVIGNDGSVRSHRRDPVHRIRCPGPQVPRGGRRHVALLRAAHPAGKVPVGHANGGLLLKDLRLPDFPHCPSGRYDAVGHSWVQ